MEKTLKGAEVAAHLAEITGSSILIQPRGSAGSFQPQKGPFLAWLRSDEQKERRFKVQDQREKATLPLAEVLGPQFETSKEQTVEVERVTAVTVAIPGLAD